ncbi:MAG: DUF1800 family protein, partial [Chloroflexales bacterium]|nr:DUF1800 family protein [Chloroflexales bacterium]
NQAPLADGEQVLDLVARHPGTASYICTKLCRRLVADEPPAALVQAAIDVWIAQQGAADQIKQVVRAILLSPEFAAAWGQKVKRPFELAASFLRITEANATPNTNLFNWLSEMGYRHFNWSPPTGHPDTADDWLSTNVTLRRWNVVNTFFTKEFGAATLDMVAKTPAGATSRQIVAFWVERVLGRPLPERSVDVLIGLMRQDAGPDVPPIGNAEDIRDRINSLVALIAMTPEFQQR